MFSQGEPFLEFRHSGTAVNYAQNSKNMSNSLMHNINRRRQRKQKSFFQNNRIDLSNGITSPQLDMSHIQNNKYKAPDTTSSKTSKHILENVILMNNLAFDTDEFKLPNIQANPKKLKSSEQQKRVVRHCKFS